MISGLKSSLPGKTLSKVNVKSENDYFKYTRKQLEMTCWLIWRHWVLMPPGKWRARHQIKAPKWIRPGFLALHFFYFYFFTGGWGPRCLPSRPRISVPCAQTLILTHSTPPSSSPSSNVRAETGCGLQDSRVNYQNLSIAHCRLKNQTGVSLKTDTEKKQPVTALAYAKYFQV